MSMDKRTIPCPPKLQRRRMIAGMGTSPAVLTETVWALAHQENELMYANYGLSCSGLLRNRKVAQTLRPRFHSSCRFDILLPAMLRQSFTDFIFATNTDGSGKAASYVRALDMLCPILTKHYPKPIVGGSHVASQGRGHVLQVAEEGVRTGYELRG